MRKIIYNALSVAANLLLAAMYVLALYVATTRAIIPSAKHTPSQYTQTLETVFLLHSQSDTTIYSILKSTENHWRSHDNAYLHTDFSVWHALSVCYLQAYNNNLASAISAQHFSLLYPFHEFL